MAAWLSEPINWVFLVLALVVALAGINVVASRNLMHSALSLAGALGGMAAIFVLLSAEFIGLTVILVYVGAVIVLFLFGILITRAPMGREVSLDNEKRGAAALIATLLFATLVGASVAAFGDADIAVTGIGTPTELIGDGLLTTFVIPFEVISFVLLAALIGGVSIARRDRTPLEAEEREAQQ